MNKGKVFLVGAGPGAEDLISLKAVWCIKKADVIIYDFLANKKFLQYAKESSEKIYVGKKGSCHTLKQPEINKLIVNKALEGKIVARLKGGDPYIFGRGGEEAEELVRAGIEFEVVPGITAAAGATAYAGIPLTHRDFTSTVAFVTGHERDDSEYSKRNHTFRKWHSFELANLKNRSFNSQKTKGRRPTTFPWQRISPENHSP